MFLEESPATVRMQKLCISQEENKEQRGGVHVCTRLQSWALMHTTQTAQARFMHRFTCVHTFLGLHTHTCSHRHTQNTYSHRHLYVHITPIHSPTLRCTYTPCPKHTCMSRTLTWINTSDGFMQKAHTPPVIIHFHGQTSTKTQYTHTVKAGI